MPYQVRLPDGSEKEYRLEELIAAAVAKQVSSNWPAKKAGEVNWGTVQGILQVVSRSGDIGIDGTRPQPSNESEVTNSESVPQPQAVELGTKLNDKPKLNMKPVEGNPSLPSERDNSSPVQVEGELLKVRRGTNLKRICVKSGSTENLVEVKENLRWVSPLAVFLLGLASVLFTKESEVTFYVSEMELQKRNLIKKIAVVSLISAPVLGGLSAVALDSLAKMPSISRNTIDSLGIIPGLLFLALALLGVILLQTKGRFLVPKRTDREWVWVAGIPRDIMSRLAQK